MTQNFRVEWVMDIVAENPEEAALSAWAAMRIPESTAMFFTCLDEQGEKHDVDLLEIEQERATERINASS